MHHHRGLLHGLYEDMSSIGRDLIAYGLLFLLALPLLVAACGLWDLADAGKSDTFVDLQTIGVIILVVRHVRRRSAKIHPEWDSTHGTPRPKYVRPLNRAELRARADRAGAASWQYMADAEARDSAQ